MRIIFSFRYPLTIGETYYTLELRDEDARKVTPFTARAESTREAWIAQCKRRGWDEEVIQRSTRSHEVMGYIHYYELEIL